LFEGETVDFEWAAHPTTNRYGYKFVATMVRPRGRAAPHHTIRYRSDE
jgi:hypothetical protein